MADSTAIAITSVSVAGITALGTPLISAWVEDRRVEKRAARDRGEKDLDELRDLLDGAAVVLEAARIATRKLTRLYRGDDPGGASTRAEVRSELIEEGRRLSRLESRMAIRLGFEHPVTSACRDAVERLRELDGLWGRWAGLAAGAVLPWADEVDAEEAYVAARDAFITAAQARVGAVEAQRSARDLIL
jgi:hypothetical protein